MKKMLLAATAAAVVGGVAFAGSPAQAQEVEGFQLRIGGFYNALVVVRSQKKLAGANKVNNIDFNQRGRYRIQGSQTLDSGLTVGFDSQYEMQTSFTTNRTYVYARGGFGNVQFGTMYSAPYLLHVSPPTAGWGIDDTGHSHGFARSGADLLGGPTSGHFFPATPTYYINRSMNLTYITPRFGGFQAGVTYAPNFTSPSFQRQVTVPSGPGGGNTANNTSIRDIFGAGVNFQQSFDDFSLALSAGLETGRWSHLGEPANSRRPWTAAAGANIGFGGFAVGAAYNFNNIGIKNARVHNVTAGLTYSVDGFTFGPSFGASWERGSAFAGDRRRIHIYELGARYAFAPGVNLVGSIEHMRTKNMDARRGTAGLFGVQMSF